MPSHWVQRRRRREQRRTRGAPTPSSAFREFPARQRGSTAADPCMEQTSGGSLSWDNRGLTLGAPTPSPASGCVPCATAQPDGGGPLHGTNTGPAPGNADASRPGTLPTAFSVLVRKDGGGWSDPLALQVRWNN